MFGYFDLICSSFGKYMLACCVRYLLQCFGEKHSGLKYLCYICDISGISDIWELFATIYEAQI